MHAFMALGACARAGSPDDGAFDEDGSPVDAHGAPNESGGGTPTHESGPSSGDDADDGAAPGDDGAQAGDGATSPASDATPPGEGGGDDETITDGGCECVVPEGSSYVDGGDGAFGDAASVDATMADGAQETGGAATLDATAISDAPMDAEAIDDATESDAPADAAVAAADSSYADVAEAAACGGCAAGFTCGSGGYCVSATGVPAFGHVIVIVMEEQSLSAIQGSSSAPYINSLIASYALATDYSAPAHPSLPNYLELTSGGAQGVQCDCAPGGTPTCSLSTSVCNPLLTSNCDCPQSVTHLGDELDTASLGWREYAEGMGSPCNLTGADGGANFTPTHVPFLYYDDVYTTPGRCAQRVRDYGDFAADLASGAYAFSMISPDTCHDMQTLCSGNEVLQGDDWLSTNVPPILATSGFGSGGHDALFIVWEEAGTDIGTPPAPLVVVSPLARATTTSAAYTHASLLATIEDGLGVARLGGSAGVAPIADVWK
jgi:acid phosphatase